MVSINVRIFYYLKLLFNCKYCIPFAKYHACQIVRQHYWVDRAVGTKFLVIGISNSTHYWLRIWNRPSRIRRDDISENIDIELRRPIQFDVSISKRYIDIFASLISMPLFRERVGCTCRLLTLVVTCVVVTDAERNGSEDGKLTGCGCCYAFMSCSLSNSGFQSPRWIHTAIIKHVRASTQMWHH